MLSHEAYTHLCAVWCYLLHTILATNFHDFQEMNCQFGVFNAIPNHLWPTSTWPTAPRLNVSWILTNLIFTEFYMILYDNWAHSDSEMAILYMGNR